MCVLDIRKRLTTLFRADGRPSTKIIAVCIVMTCMLLTGFSAWSIVFISNVNFPAEEAVSLEMVENFGGIVDSAELETYLDSNTIADEIMTGIMANLSGKVYDNIEMAEMHDEPIGLKIVKVLLDRLFS